jgi:murein DD-endopeptidase MepM/ murein hydrolase activator NlpD
MNKITTWIIIILIIIGSILVINFSRKKNPGSTTAPVIQKTSPIGQADQRVTKKPFGIYITPQTSPIQPEKFTGFHTGTDFETFVSEASADVPFYAICEGQILQKRTATGYGGMLVQSCTINSQAVTVIYGHIKLSSIAKTIGDNLSAGEQIGFLGQPPTETNSERKHLHLGIHIGTTVNILGYVQKQSDLTSWLDWQKLSK